MGFLHGGHLALAAAARRRSDFTVMSVFVNPLQFGPGEDFDAYPRDIERDRELAAKAGVEALWTPGTADLYQAGQMITVDPGAAGTILEGAIRPGHFTGVLTVVLKLFGVVQPDVAVFGRKDAQQAHLVQRMVREFNLPVLIVIVPTVRDRDLLALSSRNVYLDRAMRETALALPRALAAGAAAFAAGERRAGRVVAAAYRILAQPERDGALTVEYISVVDGESFFPNDRATESSSLVAAIRVGGRRLIDNVVLGAGLGGDPVAGAGGS
jgi:pantoate--beta-alanine ligase